MGGLEHADMGFNTGDQDLFSVQGCEALHEYRFVAAGKTVFFDGIDPGSGHFPLDFLYGRTQFGGNLLHPEYGYLQYPDTFNQQTQSIEKGGPVVHHPGQATLDIHQQ
jgi:hypothetical protein